MVCYPRPVGLFADSSCLTDTNKFSSTMNGDHYFDGNTGDSCILTVAHKLRIDDNDEAILNEPYLLLSQS